MRAFNNHAGSTKSYDYVREHNEAVNRLDFIDRPRGDHRRLRARHGRTVQQHDGSILRAAQARRRIRRARPHRRDEFPGKHAAKGEIVTGLLYVAEAADELHGHLNTVDAPLNTLDETELCPGSAALDKINASLR